MKVTLELIGMDLPEDHLAAPWKKGERRQFDPVTAAVLLNERMGHFKLVDEDKLATPKGKKPADGE